MTQRQHPIQEHSQMTAPNSHQDTDPKAGNLRESVPRVNSKDLLRDRRRIKQLEKEQPSQRPGKGEASDRSAPGRSDAAPK